MILLWYVNFILHKVFFFFKLKEKFLSSINRKFILTYLLGRYLLLDWNNMITVISSRTVKKLFQGRCFALYLQKNNVSLQKFHELEKSKIVLEIFKLKLLKNCHRPAWSAQTVIFFPELLDLQCIYVNLTLVNDCSIFYFLENMKPLFNSLSSFVLVVLYFKLT